MLWEKEQKLKGVSEAINDWLWDLDRFGNIVSLSTELATLIDFTVNNDAPQPLVIEFPFATDTSTLAAKEKIKQAISKRASFEAVQASLVKKDGGLIWVRLSASPYFSKTGEFLGYHGSATDISQNVQLEQLAYTDSLTGIANRVAFFHRVEKEMHRAKRLSYEMGVMMLDLDYFKKINDNYGHDAGDEVLRRAAQAMALCLREQDCIGRIGGEEFAIIVPGADKLGLENVAIRLRQALSPLRFSFMAEDAEITISMGFTLVRPDESFKKALNRADQHLYQAKANGRNCYVTDQEGYTDFVI